MARILVSPMLVGLAFSAACESSLPPTDRGLPAAATDAAVPADAGGDLPEITDGSTARERDSANRPGDDAGGDGDGCGDGVRAGEERCDDGDRTPGDGCDADCRVEDGWACPAEGGDCSPTCGDGLLRGAEQCDDGDVDDGDGCSRSCALELGWRCPTVGQACVAARCGDGIAVGAEQCDDGDDLPADGCDSDCKLEPGWVCPVMGADCVAARCGDGVRAGAELCDDGDEQSGDGCAAGCDAVEPNYACPPLGGECFKTTECGDGVLTSDEACDDGNKRGGDGCSASCAREPGWLCDTPGARCVPARCGDGLQVGAEQCDDGGRCAGGANDGQACTGDDACGGGSCTARGGDGCDATCNLEPGFHCPTQGAACEPTVCGDGVVQGLEQCDDGAIDDRGTADPADDVALPDHNLGDGCTPRCTREPVCSGGTCTSTCGDGILGGDEACDDGNTANNDGCSADCELEPGYRCELVTVGPGDHVTLPLVLRDFRGRDLAGGHPDFQRGGGGTGMVESTLDADGKPVRKDGAASIESQASFAQWYRDSDKSMTVVSEMRFDLKDAATGTYQFDSKHFYPLTGKGYNALPNNDPLHEALRSACGTSPQNFHFTSEIRYWFEYENDEVLDFRGDDDVWVFINGRLAVDIGGVHGAIHRCVSLRTDQQGCGRDQVPVDPQADLGLTPGGIYEVAVFQAERHTCQSSYQLTLSGFFTSRNECESVCGDGVVTPDEVCDSGSVCQGGSEDGADCGSSEALAQACAAGGGSCVSLNDGSYGRCQPGCGARGPHCGDGQLQGDEQCDDGFAGNVGAYGGCAPGCTLGPACGDGKVDSAFGEQCDDGASANDGRYGGCTDSCVFAPRCGDGTLQEDQGEQCDDGVNLSAYGGCAPGCTLAPYCGDGVIAQGRERCDDGADANDGRYDGCTAQCVPGPYCGDGVRDEQEECDDGNANRFDGCSPECEVENILI